VSVLLSCDAPNCVKNTPPIVKNGRLSAPDGWWLQPNDKGVFVVGCCDNHFVMAAKISK